MIDIIIKPIITEKMTALTEKIPERYAFRVSPKANKVQIKKAIEDLYGVKVLDVNTINVKPKVKVRYTKAGIIKGSPARYKKAIITLAKGETIDFFKNI